MTFNKKKKKLGGRKTFFGGSKNFFWGVKKLFGGGQQTFLGGSKTFFGGVKPWFKAVSSLGNQARCQVAGRNTREHRPHPQPAGRGEEDEGGRLALRQHPLPQAAGQHHGHPREGWRGLAGRRRRHRAFLPPDQISEENSLRKLNL